MKYLILMRGSSQEQDEAVDAHARSIVLENDATEDWVAETDASGARILGERLRPDSEGKRVSRRGRQVRVTDGPFAEAKEHIGGFDVLECASLEEAVAVAAKHPFTEFGTIEVREAWPFD